MTSNLGSRGFATLAFALIFTLVAGGLGWMTLAVIRLEREQSEARFEAAAPG